MVSVKIKGIDEGIRNLEGIRRVTPQELAAALDMEAELIMTNSKRVVPVDLGTLRASGHVKEPKVTGGHVKVTMAYGGAASAYALIQHEGFFNHPGQGERKYLEGPARAAARGMGNRVASRIKRAWGRFQT